MKKTALLSALAAGLCISISSFAQAPASAPAGTTGLCKDGTLYSGASKKGACSGHKGLKTWYGASKAAAASGASAATAPAAAASAPAAASGTPGATAATKSAASAGAPGQVWVNTDTNVYHCATDKYYGKTKHGEYLSEAAAKAKGFHASHGKACS
ncbi:hypothetical protein WT60_22765 [Burkholderia sp. MSMB617WGS]|uniref:DUF3761 domain-containing protein n=1 Tax=Burkholderia TaxID=32008 RepID=UPI00075FC2AE|nr:MULTISPECIES: DUF3761 domain-containing protein [Burkholderia]AOK49713.1 hypothetical protein WT60_22765 [Burkholderia sp. MSMB617WGS]KWZ47964.1 hypothetical protein WS73_05360 [Burkholderia savannae]